MTQQIAIIGSGIAGLTAAYRCKQAGHAVTVFEAHQGYGMDAHQVRHHGGVVDVPLRVMSPARWPGVIGMANELGVGTFPVDTFVSCSALDTGRSQTAHTWLRSRRLPILNWPFISAPRHLNKKSVITAYGLWRLAQKINQPHALDANDTLADFLKREKLHPAFWRGLVLPILTTICTCDEADLLAWPTAQLLGLLHDILHGATLCRLQGGTSALVKKLAAASQARLHAGSPVRRLCSTPTGISVENSNGEGGVFDRVIVATQANQLDFLDDSIYAPERQILAGIPYAQGELFVHTDTSVMPRRRSDWAALNFQTDAASGRSIFHVWVNAVEPGLANQPPVFQTWNPLFELNPQKILSRTRFQRAVVRPTTAPILKQLQQWHQQPGRRLFYVGSWAHEGVPLLESATQSSEQVVRIIQRHHS